MGVMRRESRASGRRSWRIAATVLLATMGLVAAACGDDDDDVGGEEPTTAAPGGATTTAGGGGATTTPPSTIPADADPNGRLRIATNLGIATGYFIDPIKGASVSYDGIAYLHLGTPLFLDRDGTIKPFLAEGYEIPDETTFVLKLRSGLTYHDGQAYDAQSLKTMYEAKLASTETAWIGGVPRQIASMTVDSPTQLTFKMKAPVAGLMPVLMTQTFSHSAAPGYDPAKPAGAGPYRVVEHQERVKLVLEKWDGFFRADDYLIKTVEFIEVPGGGATLNALQADQVDLGPTSPNQVQQLASAGNLGVVFTNNQAHYHFVSCNAAPPFNDVKFREAFYLAINQEAMNQGVMGGEAEVMTSLWPEDSPYAVPNLIDPDGDQARARQLVQENGWEGTVVRIGMFNVPTQQRIAEVIQAQIREVGLDAELIPFPPGVSPNAVFTPQNGGGFVVANVYPGIAKLIQSPLLSGPGPLQGCDLGPTAHADLREDANAIIAGKLTEAELVQRWQNLQRNIMRQFLDMPALSQPAVYLYNKRVVGLKEGTVGLTAATAPSPFLEGVYIKKG